MKKSIAIICSRLDQPGGTERAVINLAGLFKRNGHAVTLVILDSTADSFYHMDEGIKIIHQDLDFGISDKGNMITRKMDLFRDIKKLKKILVSLAPQVVIGSEYHLTIVSWLAARNLPARIMGWENHHIYWLKKNRFWTFLFRSIYPKLSAVVCQNATEQKLFAALGCRSVVIPYSVPSKAPVPSSLSEKNILTIGWLIKRKGVDLIPAIAEKVYQKHPDWKWKLIGSGEEYERLKNEIEQRKLSSFLTIQKPVSENISKEYQQASMYVMTSRSECLPMVLLEATGFGLPLVAFDCPSGPADIIHHGQDGFVLPMEDINGMANAVSTLIEDEEKRKQMGYHSLKNSLHYTPERVYELWKALLEKN